MRKLVRTSNSRELVRNVTFRNLARVDGFSTADALKLQTGSSEPNGNVTPTSLPAIYFKTDDNRWFITNTNSNSAWQEIFTT